MGRALARIEEGRSAFKILTGKPSGNSPLGKPRRRWEDNIIGEKRTLLNNILRIKVNFIGHILGRKCLLHDAIEGQMSEVKG